MKILLSLILLLSMPSALKVEQIPFPAQCPAETSCRDPGVIPWLATVAFEGEFS